MSPQRPLLTSFAATSLLLAVSCGAGTPVSSGRVPARVLRSLVISGRSAGYRVSGYFRVFQPGGRVPRVPLPPIGSGETVNRARSPLTQLAEAESFHGGVSRGNRSARLYQRYKIEGSFELSGTARAFTHTSVQRIRVGDKEAFRVASQHPWTCGFFEPAAPIGFLEAAGALPDNPYDRLSTLVYGPSRAGTLRGESVWIVRAHAEHIRSLDMSHLSETFFISRDHNTLLRFESHWRELDLRIVEHENYGRYGRRPTITPPRCTAKTRSPIR